MEVQANIEYRIQIPSEYASWIKQQPSSQPKKGESSYILLEIEASKEYDKREGKVIIGAGSLSDTLKVYQIGSPVLVLTKNEYDLPAFGGGITVEVSSNFDFEVEMPDVDWVEISEQETRAISPHTRLYTILPNETPDERKANLIFKDKNSSLSETVKITQEQKNVLDISKKTFEASYNDTIIEITIDANIDFDILIPDGSNTWIKQKETKALVTHSAIFEISSNVTANSRIGKIIFSNIEKEISDTIRFYQAGLPEYIMIAKNEESNDTRYDYAILGIGEYSFFYELDENNLPKEFVAIDNQNETVKNIVHFNEKGFPSSISADEYTLVFSNYVGNKMDFVIIYDGQLTEYRGVETSINWDEYSESRPSTRATSTSVIKWTSVVVNAASCAAGFAAGVPTGGLSIAMSAISCGSAIVSIIDAFGFIPLEVGIPISIGSHYANIGTCAQVSKDPRLLTACYLGLLANVVSKADIINDLMKDDVELGEGYLGSGTGEVKVTLTWGFEADIDLHVVEPSGFRIYFGNPNSPSGGFLDHDNLYGPGHGPENIFWSEAPEGVYRVLLDHYSGDRSGSYSVVVKVKDEITTYTGHIGIGETISITTFDLNGIINRRGLTISGNKDEILIETIKRSRVKKVNK